MFIREVKSRGKTYLNIIESFWKDGKSRHRSIASLGRLDILKDSDQLFRIANALLKYCKEKQNFRDISTSEEMGRRSWGYPSVFRKLWDLFGLEPLLSGLLKGSKTQFDFFSAVFLMLVDRLSDPKSKLACYEKQEKYHGIRRNELQHLYRALDILSDGKEKIENHLFEKNRNLFNMRVDVILYDVTTIYFESTVVV